MNSTMIKASHLFAGLSMSAVVAACGTVETDNEYRNAIPTAETIEVALPAARGQALMRANEGETSEFYKLTRHVSRNVNGAALRVLGLVRLVVSFPPTETYDDRAVWGPWSDALDPVEWKVTVQKVSDDEFHYGFDGRDKTQANAAFSTVLSGTSGHAEGRADASRVPRRRHHR
jgi:hypothetical protein